MAHDHFERLDHIGGSYPYECVDDGLRFSDLDVREHQTQRMREQDAAKAAAGTAPAEALTAWENGAQDRGELAADARRTTRDGAWRAEWVSDDADAAEL